MRVGLVAVIVAAALIVGSQSARAEKCDGLQDAQQIMTGLASSDAIVRTQSEICGLARSDRAVRGLVIRKFLSGGDVLNISVENIQGDKDGATFCRIFHRLKQTKLNGAKMAGNSPGHIACRECL